MSDIRPVNKENFPDTEMYLTHAQDIVDRESMRISAENFMATAYRIGKFVAKSIFEGLAGASGLAIPKSTDNKHD